MIRLLNVPSLYSEVSSPRLEVSPPYGSLVFDVTVKGESSKPAISSFDVISESASVAEFPSDEPASESVAMDPSDSESASAESFTVVVSSSKASEDDVSFSGASVVEVSSAEVSSAEISS